MKQHLSLKIHFKRHWSTVFKSKHPFKKGWLSILLWLPILFFNLKKKKYESVRVTGTSCKWSETGVIPGFNRTCKSVCTLIKFALALYRLSAIPKFLSGCFPWKAQVMKTNMTFERVYMQFINPIRSKSSRKMDAFLFLL